MASEIRLPDIGDFKDVPIIEIHVKPGQTVAKEEVMLTLESDKATLDVPAPDAGVIGEIKVKVGDKVSQGALLATWASSGASAPAAEPAGRPPGPPPGPRPSDARRRNGGTRRFRMRRAGARRRAGRLHRRLSRRRSRQEGRAGRPAADAGRRLPQRRLHSLQGAAARGQGDRRGGRKCPRAASSSPRRKSTSTRCARWKESVVKRLTTGLTGLARQRKVTVVAGEGAFTSPHTLAVATAEGQRVIRFTAAIIAAGSEPAAPGFIPRDPRVWDSTDALELRFVPKRLLVLGGGVIGLEMATVYAALGAKITVIEMMDQLMPGADRDIVAPLAKRVEKRYEKILLETKVTAVEARRRGLARRLSRARAARATTSSTRCWFRSGAGPTAARSAPRRRASRSTSAASSPSTSRCAPTFPISSPSATSSGSRCSPTRRRTKARSRPRRPAAIKSAFDAKAIPAVAYTDPEVAWVGVTESEAKAKGLAFGKAVFPWAASGRSLSLGRDEGLTKTLWDEESGRLIGCGIVGPNAGDLIAEAALAIEMGCDAEDIGLTIHPHPTLSETFAMSAEAYAGTLTDLYMPKKSLESAFSRGSVRAPLDDAARLAGARVGLDGAGSPPRLARPTEYDRRREVIALRDADARVVAQIGELLRGFDAFDDHLRAQRLADRFDRPQQALIARPLMDRGDERAVDLDLVGGDLGERRQRGIADAEIVDRDLRADLAQHRRDLQLELAGEQERFLGEFDHEAARVAAGGEPVGEGAHEADVARLLGGDVEAERRPGPNVASIASSEASVSSNSSSRHFVHQARR